MHRFSTVPTSMRRSWRRMTSSSPRGSIFAENGIGWQPGLDCLEGRFSMESDHEFTVQLTGEGTFVIKLLESVQIEGRGDAVVGRWSAFDLEAQGDTEAEVYQELLGGLQKQIGAGPGSPEFKPFAAYVRKHGTRLSDEEAAARELAKLREITVRWRVTNDEQYTVRLFE